MRVDVVEPPARGTDVGLSARTERPFPVPPIRRRGAGSGSSSCCAAAPCRLDARLGVVERLLAPAVVGGDLQLGRGRRGQGQPEERQQHEGQHGQDQGEARLPVRAFPRAPSFGHSSAPLRRHGRRTGPAPRRHGGQAAGRRRARQVDRGPDAGPWSGFRGRRRRGGPVRRRSALPCASAARAPGHRDRARAA